MPSNNPASYPFSPPFIQAHAPASSGVYALYTEQQWIYFGESMDIRERLLQHHANPSACMARFPPESFSFELLPDRQRVARQDQLILEFRPVCNERLG